MRTFSTVHEPRSDETTSDAYSNQLPTVSFAKPSFRYEPFPIGVFHDFLPKEFYHRLTASWPSVERFVCKENLGHKYSLSELNNHAEYIDFIRLHPDWRSLYQIVKSPDFSHNIIRELCNRSIDLGLSDRRISCVHEFSSGLEKLKAALNKLPRLITKRESPLSVRFEFSMLPAAGGHIKPHTDAPQKLITLVLSMVREGEWDESWGGGTEVLKPKDITRNFNFLNKQLEFDEVETIDVFPFQPNQCVVFVKTFNSFHSVSPMTGPNDGTMRKTLTINIESWGCRG